MGKIVYSRNYNIGFVGLERLHPFDSHKYGRAWKCLRKDLGSGLNKMAVYPRRPVRRDDLLAVHSSAYLDRRRNSKYVAQALELPSLCRAPLRKTLYVLSWANPWVRELDRYALRGAAWGEINLPSQVPTTRSLRIRDRLKLPGGTCT